MGLTVQHVDYIIIGRGLAGIVVSELLQEQGHSVVIYDQPKPNQASAVAAGSMNPIAMKRIIMSWRAGEFLHHAVPFYRRLEARYNTTLLTALPAMRIHASEEENQLWRQRELEFPVGNHITEGTTPAKVLAPHGTGSINTAFLLNVQELLKHHESHWDKAGRIRRTPFSENEIAPNSQVIECTGPFSDLPGLIPVQGELLTLHIPKLSLNHSLHRSGFLIPLINDRFRLGATFEWKQVWSGPSEEAKTALLEKLEQMINLPFTVEDHWAGTRPTTKDRRPLVGKHPNKSGRYVLNGLGSKGAMIAPWCAQHLCDHLLHGKAIDPEVSSTRFSTD